MQIDQSRSYGVSRSYPSYFNKTVQFIKTASIAERQHQIRSSARLLLDLATEVSHENSLILDSMKPHVKRVNHGKNVLIGSEKFYNPHISVIFTTVFRVKIKDVHIGFRLDSMYDFSKSNWK